jgi:diacylglycerol kinase family enzyme
VKHLFIVNPASGGVKSRKNEIVGMIETFFADYPGISYDIYVTRWKRDAVGYVRKYALASDEFVRVYAVGGTSTLFEVINGAIGLPNVQVANYPLGYGNSFPHCFGNDKFHLFLSLRNLVFAGVKPIDAIRCGYNYGIAFGLLGLESCVCRDGDNLMEKIGSFAVDLCYFGVAMYDYFRRDPVQNYKIRLDGKTLDGDYASLFVGNGSRYGKKMIPGPDARPDDGLLDLYLIKRVPRLRQLTVGYDYIRGFYGKWPDYISHFTGRSLAVSSDKNMCVCIDGEIFYDTAIDFEIMPYAVDFVCPEGAELPYAGNSAG